MLDFGFYNMDCMEGMKEFPDKYFDLAIVDPVFGGVTKGGYMFGKCGEHLAKRIDYNLALWEQPKTGNEYFKELFRVSKNQIIWGAITLYLVFKRIANVGLYGINNILKGLNMLIANWRGLVLIVQLEYLDLGGMECCKVI